MKSVKFILSILLFVVFISCQDTDNEILEIRVSHYQEIRYKFPGPHLSYLVQIDEKIGGDEWSGISGISDFEYEWGYTYKILVAKKYFSYDEPLADAPLFRFVFLKELSKEKVAAGTEFEITLQRVHDDGTVEKFIEGNKENGYKILSQKEFNCEDLCDELTRERDHSTFLTGTFRHAENGNIQLVDVRNEELSRYYN